MMNQKEFATSIRRAWGLASRLRLGLSFSSAVGLSVDDEFRDAVLDDVQIYETVYRIGLKKSHYNFVFVDYAYFQFSSMEGSTRYAFYPNPFRARSETLDLIEQMEEGLISFEELSDLLADEPMCIGVPPIRYEYAPQQYREIEHPCAHFHIGYHGDNRWPIARALTPAAFTMWIIRMYYFREWGELDDEQDEFGNKLDGDLARERSNCAMLPEERFWGREKRLFHFR